MPDTITIDRPVTRQHVRLTRPDQIGSRHMTPLQRAKMLASWLETILDANAGMRRAELWRDLHMVLWGIQDLDRDVRVIQSHLDLANERLARTTPGPSWAWIVSLMLASIVLGALIGGTHPEWFGWMMVRP